MTPDEWQAHVTRAAALEIGKWLEARGKLHLPIASLTLGDLEAIAVNAISRWIVLQSKRLQRQDWPQEDPVAMLLLGEQSARSARVKPAASATSTGFSTTVTPITASARSAVRIWAAQSLKGTTA